MSQDTHDTPTAGHHPGPHTEPTRPHEPEADENSELQIEVAREPVRVVTRAGNKFLAEAYVHRASALHPGAETLLDRLNHPQERFLPCRVGGREELIHLEQVAMIEQDREPPEMIALRELGAHPEAVEIDLVTGHTLRGEVIYLAPAGRSRISDLLNHPTDTFLLMITGEMIRLVHRGAILRVRF